MEPPVSPPEVSDDAERLEGLAAIRCATLSLVQAAKYDLAICSHELEPLLYNEESFTEAVSHLARNGRHARVRLLIREHDTLVRQGHRLLRLAQQIPSHVEIRRIAPEHRHSMHGFLIADDGVFYQPQTTVYEARVSMHDRRWARSLSAEFQRLWDHSIDDPHLRRLAFVG